MIGVCAALLEELKLDDTQSRHNVPEALLQGNRHPLLIRRFFDANATEPSSQQWLTFEENLSRLLLALIASDGDPDRSIYDPPFDCWDTLESLGERGRHLFYRTVGYCSGYHSATLHHRDLAED